MRSIKPGRGPSMMGGISFLFVAAFGVIWTIIVASMGGGLMALFGIFFVIYAIIGAVYNIKNATQPNRYSLFDITEHGEEIDPLNAKYGNQNDNFYDEYQNINNNYYNNNNEPHINSSKFCPYCGTAAAPDFEFCNSCGKKLP